ncbi:hypothetical protein [uncultured Desulfovibrio sp.]|uniref:hypothetical protein n=1 Tax=uncultured Desulfovibrio sp. TaxID=167968 RepID=UPI0003A2BE36|nr:hypothetical protein [uncultured Desulfovibrio sp.]
MPGSLLILAFFGADLGLARLGLIPRYFVDHNATPYVLWLLMGLAGLSIGSDRRMGEILRTLRPRACCWPHWPPLRTPSRAWPAFFWPTAWQTA